MSEKSTKKTESHRKPVKRAKSARKSGSKSRVRSSKPVKAKKPAQSRAKRTKSTTKKTQVRKRAKTVRKSGGKKPRTGVQSKKQTKSRTICTGQWNGLLDKYFKKKKSIKKTRKSVKKTPKPSLFSRSFFAFAVLAGFLGFIYGRHEGVNGYVDALNNHVYSTVAPSRITTAGPAQNNPHFSKYPTWSQNFSTDTSGKPDSRYWNISKGAPQNENKEAQYYTDNPANIHIKDGALSLVATHQKQPGNYNYASAQVDTKKKLSFLYGRIDVTAKLPSGVGTWPAVWFLPANTKYRDMGAPGDSLRHLNGGEIDLIEAVGFNPNIEYGVAHTRSDQKNHPDGIGSFDQIEVPNNDKEYNTYSLLWTPTDISLAVNDATFFTYDKPAGSDYTTWPFDQPFYMIVNLALGGVWGGMDTGNFPGNGIDNSALPAAMDIKSIHYYPYNGSNGSRQQ